jgi:hypothetical protein
MPLHIEAKFVPQPDITAYELAVIVSKTRGYNAEVIRFTTAQWESLDPAICRHFSKED